MSDIKPTKQPDLQKQGGVRKANGDMALRLRDPINGGAGTVVVCLPAFTYLPYSRVHNPYSLRRDIACLTATPMSISLYCYLQDSFKEWLSIELDKVDSKYSIAFDIVLANLWLTHERGQQLLTPMRKCSDDWRNPNKIGYKLIHRTLQFLTESKYIHMIKGKPSEFDGISSWATPDESLIHIFQVDKIRTKLRDNNNFIELHKTIRKPNMPKAVINVKIPVRFKAKVKRLSKTVRAYNQLWSSSVVHLDGKHITPWCYRIFNETLDMGGRFYGDYQNLPKADRRRLVINGMRTLEPDYSALHPNLLYANEGIQLKLHDDVYQVGGYDRKVIKRVMLSLLNTSDVSALATRITTSGKPKNKQLYETMTLERKGMEANQIKSNGFYKMFMIGMPDNVDGVDLIAQLLERHKPIAHRFGEKHLGIKLMNQDSNIMANVLDVLIAKHIPALPIHDSLRCKISDLDIVVNTMQEQYKLLTGHKITVSYKL